MNRPSTARVFSLGVLAALAACSGGGGATGDVRTGGDFVVLKTEPSDNGQLFLNDSIAVDFSAPVDLNSVNLATFGFQVLDQIGNPVAEPVAGNFEIGRSPGDAEPGRRLLFKPKLPTNDLFTNGGFRPGRTYLVQLVGGSRINGTVLRDSGGKGLAAPVSFRISTADGANAAQLFRNTVQGGPRRTGITISPTPDATGVVLNKLGAPPVEIRLSFDQPLNPNTGNVPTSVELNALRRSSTERGRVYLAYDDVLGENQWIPAEVELERNEIDGSTLVLRPLGVLPNNALVKVVVEPTLEDIAGESNQSNSGYQEVVASFTTKRAYEQQFDAVVESFVGLEAVDLEAAFAEPQAEVGPGYVRAGFNFEGAVTGAVFSPTVPETILNTDVGGGVFNYRSVNIAQGRVVRGQGSKPMVWLVQETFQVDGLLSVAGGQGTRVTALANADVPKPGGAGSCGGGDGGAGSPSTTKRDAAGAVGNGPMQIPGGGGAGGLLSCAVGCGRGAGGGGGSLATQGDPNFKQKVLPPNSPNNAQAIFQQQTGKGGNGCVGAAGAAARVVEGSAPGRTVFEDGRSDNNFWGVGVRFDGTPLRITGELSAPVGGGGGGGGGDLSYNSDCTIEVTTFANDSSGGGGGGGGGVLIVKALDSIIVGPTGRITADGGNGGGGEQQGSSSRGGGGGGGAGGMVILMSAKEIVINARGSNNKFRYSENDYDFSISADGGACTTLNFVVTNAPIVTQKYQANASGVIDNTYRTTYDLAPLGGFGGMGIVQLMAPAGTNADATNTILDDNIRVLRNGASQDGTAKRDLLAWRGFPTATASFADDFGNPVAIGDSEGDIRPAPILLPAPFGTKTRVRSQWIDTGATRRRPLSALTGDDNLPRGIVLTPGTEAGPRYEFSGTELSGFAKYGIVGSTAKLVYDLAVPHANILTADPTASFLGKPAYRIELVSPSLGSVVDRFSQYDAELLNGAGTVVGSFRILAHTDRELFVSAESGALPANAVSAGVRAKLFRLVTNGVDGAFPTYPGFTGNRVPTCNVKIGFAFHTDPSNPTAARYPTQPGSFAYDLTSQSVQDAVRDLGATFVQWDILFDVGFREQPQDAAPRFSPGTPRPELRDLRLPFRF